MFNRFLNNIKNYLNVFTFSTIPPFGIIVVLTYRCSLKCNFCFIKGLENEFKQDMTPESFNLVLSWIKKSRIKTFVLSGGEPTEYAYFKEAMKLIAAHKLQVIIATNNLYPASMPDILPKKNIRFILLNYNKEGYTEEQGIRFKDNLKRLNKIGFRLGLQLNIWRNSYDQEIIELARKYRSEIHLTLSCPGYSGNVCVQPGELGNFSKTVVDFIRECKVNRVKTIFSRPIIPCIFGKEDLEILKPSAVRYMCNTIPVVNPDLSVFACLTIFKKFSSLFGFKDLNMLRKTVDPYSDSLRRIPLFDDCLRCELFQRDRCQGGCLAYKQFR
jgi:MoaA/NifB/PqqE/SkfB family radical SAM enzyme